MILTMTRSGLILLGMVLLLAMPGWLDPTCSVLDSHVLASACHHAAGESADVLEYFIDADPLVISHSSIDYSISVVFQSFIQSSDWLLRPLRIAPPDQPPRFS